MLSLKSILLQVGIVLLLPVLSLVAAQCDPVTKSNGIVCRCNSTYCDKIQSHPAITVDKIVVYTSSQAGKRLEMEVLSIPNSVVVPSDAIPVKLNGLEHQKILGFGGSFTDAAAYVLSALPNAAQDKFISSYFSRQGGARYSMGRVPLGGADFSRKSYSLVQTANDFALSDFAIQDDNSVPGVDYKLNLILRALQEIGNTSAELSQVLKEFKVFASIWSAPVWMKTCKSPPAPSGTNSCGSGFIPWILGRPKNPTFLFGGLSDTTAIRNAYTQYWLKFLRAYNQSGVSLWGLSPQNEPAGNPTGNKWDNTNYSPQDLVNFVNQFLGPAVKSVFPNMKIIIGDDQLPTIPDYASRAVQSSYIDGVGYHWYNTMAGSLIGTGVLVGDVIGGQIEVSKAANQYSMNNRGNNKFLLMTEACTGYVDNVVEPGSWERGYNYMTDILHELESGSAGWVDWNLALNMSGGPNHAGNTVDAPILIDSTVGEFYKQPMYYALAHFSTFVPPGAIRLGITNANLGFIGPDLALEVIAFRQAENSDTCVLVIANDHLTASLPARGFSDVHTVVFELPSGKKMLIEMGEHEFKSILFHCPLPQGSLLNNDAPEANQVTIALATGGAGILCIAGVLGAFILVRRRAAKRKPAETETATEIATTRPNAPSI